MSGMETCARSDCLSRSVLAARENQAHLVQYNYLYSCHLYSCLYRFIGWRGEKRDRCRIAQRREPTNIIILPIEVNSPKKGHGRFAVTGEAVGLSRMLRQAARFVAAPSPAGR
jgi:hypothetical protein